MKDNPKNKINPWILAIRLRTLPAAMAPIFVGVSAAVLDDSFQFFPALAALLGAICLQIISNLANDVYDYEKGTDSYERLGPTRVTQSGLLSPTQVKRGIIFFISISLIIGIYLIIQTGWLILIIGVLAIMSAIAYTAGPFPLGYHGLGDLFVFIFFGIAATMGTYYVQTQDFTLGVFLASLPIGFLTVNILVINNLRDIQSDRKTGKGTLAVRIGEKWTRIEFIILLVLSYTMVLLLVAFNLFPTLILITWVTIPLAIRITNRVYSQTGRALNIALAESGMLDFLFGLLFLGGVLISQII